MIKQTKNTKITNLYYSYNNSLINPIQMKYNNNIKHFQYYSDYGFKE